MARKGAKSNEEATALAEDLVEQFQPLGAVSGRKMFGGHGIFCEKVMFALVSSDGAAYLRVDDEFRAELEIAGSTSFERMPCMSIPEEAEDLLDLGGRSLEIARAAKR
jgi:DNA transformation protein and related proteins